MPGHRKGRQRKERRVKPFYLGLKSGSDPVRLLYIQLCRQKRSRKGVVLISSGHNSLTSWEESLLNIIVMNSIVFSVFAALVLQICAFKKVHSFNRVSWSSFLRARAQKLCRFHGSSSPQNYGTAVCLWKTLKHCLGNSTMRANLHLTFPAYLVVWESQRQRDVPEDM